MNPWLLVGAGALLLLGGLLKASTASAASGQLNWPKGSTPYKGLVRKYAEMFNIPVPILVTWIYQESRFDPEDYNPEPTAIQKWACEVADPKYQSNPDWQSAVEVCRRLQAGEDRKVLLAQSSQDVPFEDRPWKFGSTGLVQVAPLTAWGANLLDVSESVKVLYDPDTNLRIASQIILRRRDRLYPGQTKLTLEEWSRVRAAYVGGPGILTQKPEKAAEIAQKFIDRYKIIVGS